MTSVLVVGESILDVVMRADGSSESHPGGSPANVAVGLARLGRDVTLVTELGDDAPGALIREHLATSGVAVSVAPSDAPTATALARIDARGAAAYEFTIHWRLVADRASIPARPDHVHTGSISSHLPPGASEVARIVREARASATVSYDPNIRVGLSGERASVVSRTEIFVALADVVKASDEDMRWLYPGIELDDVARRWMSLGAGLVVATLGADGSRAWCRESIVHVPPRKVDVVDTVGAGDSYMAALIDGLVREGLTGTAGRESLADVPLRTISRVVERAADAAAITVSRAGANPPWAHELPGE